MPAAISALAALRSLLLSVEVAGSKKLLCDVIQEPSGGSAFCFRDDGKQRLCYGCTIAGQTVTPASHNNPECKKDPARCKRSMNFMGSCTNLGRKVLLCYAQGSEIHVVLWDKSSEDPKICTVAGHLVYARDRDAAGQQLLRPLHPVGHEWVAALQAVTGHLYDGPQDLEQLLANFEEHGMRIYISNLWNTYDIASSDGRIFILEHGKDMSSLPATPTGRALYDLEQYLGMLRLKHAMTINLQSKPVKRLDAVSVTQHITRRRRQYGPSQVVCQSGPQPLTLTITLTLGYDEFSDNKDTDEFGIHVYVKDILFHTFFKLHPMLKHQKRILGVCTIQGFRELPQPNFLSADKNFKPAFNQLEAWLNEFIRWETAGCPSMPVGEVVTLPELQPRFEVQQRQPLAGAHAPPTGGEPQAKRQRMDLPPGIPIPGAGPAQEAAANLQASSLPASGGSSPKSGTPAAPAVAGGFQAAMRRSPSFNASETALTSAGQSGALGGKGAPQPRASAPVPAPAPSTKGRSTRTGSARELRSRTEYSRWENIALDLVDYLMESWSHKGAFNEPVNPSALSIPDYFQVIPLPMDFGTVRSLLEKHVYTHFTQALEHLLQTVDNTRRYNPPDNLFHEYGDVMEKVLLSKLRKELPQLQEAARDNPPTEPAPEYAHMFKVNDAAGAPDKTWRGLWPPVAATVASTGFPLAGIRPYSREAEEAMYLNLNKRRDAASRSHDQLQLETIVYVSSVGALLTSGSKGLSDGGAAAGSGQNTAPGSPKRRSVSQYVDGLMPPAPSAGIGSTAIPGGAAGTSGGGGIKANNDTLSNMALAALQGVTGKLQATRSASLTKIHQPAAGVAGSKPAAGSGVVARGSTPPPSIQAGRVVQSAADVLAGATAAGNAAAQGVAHVGRTVGQAADKGLKTKAILTFVAETVSNLVTAAAAPGSGVSLTPEMNQALGKVPSSLTAVMDKIGTLVERLQASNQAVAERDMLKLEVNNYQERVRSLENQEVILKAELERFATMAQKQEELINKLEEQLAVQVNHSKALHGPFAGRVPLIVPPLDDDLLLEELDVLTDLPLDALKSVAMARSGDAPATGVSGGVQRETVSPFAGPAAAVAAATSGGGQQQQQQVGAAGTTPAAAAPSEPAAAAVKAEAGVPGDPTPHVSSVPQAMDIESAGTAQATEPNGGCGQDDGQAANTTTDTDTAAGAVASVSGAAAKVDATELSPAGDIGPGPAIRVLDDDGPATAAAAMVQATAEAPVTDADVQDAMDVDGNSA